MIKAVIFDWGGVVAPIPNGGWFGALSDTLDMTVEDFLPHCRAAGYKDFCRGAIDEAEFFQLLAVSLGRELPSEISKAWIDGSAIEPWPEMISFVQQLKNDNLKVCLLSNTVKPMSVVIRHKGFYDDFEPLILSDEVGLAKPELPIYQMVLDKLQLPANECIYIDDSPKNLEPAKELGMVTVLASDNPKETIASIQRVLK